MEKFTEEDVLNLLNDPKLKELERMPMLCSMRDGSLRLLEFYLDDNANIIWYTPEDNLEVSYFYKIETPL